MPKNAPPSELYLRVFLRRMLAPSKLYRVVNEDVDWRDQYSSCAKTLKQ